MVGHRELVPKRTFRQYMFTLTGIILANATMAIILVAIIQDFVAFLVSCGTVLMVAMALRTMWRIFGLHKSGANE